MRRRPRRRSERWRHMPRRPGSRRTGGVSRARRGTGRIRGVRPPVELHKGKGIERLLRDADVDVALYAGDDRTDVDAFRALRAAVEDGRLQAAVCLGVRSDETPPEVDEAADLMVDGTAGVRVVLETLAG